jgi:hypothetical protein
MIPDFLAACHDTFSFISIDRPDKKPVAHGLTSLPEPSLTTVSDRLEFRRAVIENAEIRRQNALSHFESSSSHKDHMGLTSIQREQQFIESLLSDTTVATLGSAAIDLDAPLQVGREGSVQSTVKTVSNVGASSTLTGSPLSSVAACSPDVPPSSGSPMSRDMTSNDKHGISVAVSESSTIGELRNGPPTEPKAAHGHLPDRSLHAGTHSFDIDPVHTEEDVRKTIAQLEERLVSLKSHGAVIESELHESQSAYSRAVLHETEAEARVSQCRREFADAQLRVSEKEVSMVTSARELEELRKGRRSTVADTTTQDHSARKLKKALLAHAQLQEQHRIEIEMWKAELSKEIEARIRAEHEKSIGGEFSGRRKGEGPAAEGSTEGSSTSNIGLACVDASAATDDVTADDSTSLPLDSVGHDMIAAEPELVSASSESESGTSASVAASSAHILLPSSPDKCSVEVQVTMPEDVGVQAPSATDGYQPMPQPDYPPHAIGRAVSHHSPPSSNNIFGTPRTSGRGASDVLAELRKDVTMASTEDDDVVSQSHASSVGAVHMSSPLLSSTSSAFMDRAGPSNGLLTHHKGGDAVDHGIIPPIEGQPGSFIMSYISQPLRTAKPTMHASFATSLSLMEILRAKKAQHDGSMSGLQQRKTAQPSTKHAPKASKLTNSPYALPLPGRYDLLQTLPPGPYSPGKGESLADRPVWKPTSFRPDDLDANDTAVLSSDDVHSLRSNAWKEATVSHLMKMKLKEKKAANKSISRTALPELSKR